jgi:hypothetical protein
MNAPAPPIPEMSGTTGAERGMNAPAPPMPERSVWLVVVGALCWSTERVAASGRKVSGLP